MKRKTSLGQALLRVLKAANSPITVPDLQSRLSQNNILPNKTSLYRQLSGLSKDGIIETVLLRGDVAYFEFKRHHHHHVICQQCDAIECMADAPLELAIHAFEDGLSRSGFAVDHHQFCVFGRCAKCVDRPR